MKKYNAPTCEIANVDAFDVMTASGFGESFDWNAPTSRSSLLPSVD